MNAQLQAMPEDMDPEGNAPAGWQLKKLTERHKSVCALLAQGLPQVTVATMCGITPTYVGMLLRQPLCMQYIKDMSAVAGVQLESLFAKSVEVVADVMTTGNATEKLKAARLHGELTKRLGSGGLPPQESPAIDRLEVLANRLTGLLYKGKERSERDAIEEGEFTEITAEVPLPSAGRSGSPTAQEDGAGDQSRSEGADEG